MRPLVPFYDRDGIRLYCGDSRQVTEWLEADVLVFDPPYGVDNGRPTAKTKGENKAIVTPGRDRTILNDKDTKVRDEILRMWDDRPALCFGSWRVSRPSRVRQRLLWIKAGTNPALGGTAWSSADEEIYVLGGDWPGKRRLNYFITREPRSGIGGYPSIVGHPNAKPIDLMSWLLERCPSGCIADPCAGSGATLIAAKLAGRTAIGVEQDPKYCALIASRLEAVSGRTGLFAELDRSGSLVREERL